MKLEGPARRTALPDVRPARNAGSRADSEAKLLFCNDAENF
jgi:hypothetical protein